MPILPLCASGHSAHSDGRRLDGPPPGRPTLWDVTGTTLYSGSSRDARVTWDDLAIVLIMNLALVLIMRGCRDGPSVVRMVDRTGQPGTQASVRIARAS